jgi:hypothetical protein
MKYYTIFCISWKVQVAKTNHFALQPSTVMHGRRQGSGCRGGFLQHDGGDVVVVVFGSSIAYHDKCVAPLVENIPVLLALLFAVFARLSLPLVAPVWGVGVSITSSRATASSSSATAS